VLGLLLLPVHGYLLRDIVPGIFDMKMEPALLNPFK